MSRVKKICVTLAPLIVAVLWTPVASADWPYLEITDYPDVYVADLALDPATGLPCVAYWESQQYGDWVLWYTEYDGSGWTGPDCVTSLDHTQYRLYWPESVSLVKDATLGPLIAYSYICHNKEPGADEASTAARFAYTSGGGWVTEAVYYQPSDWPDGYGWPAVCGIGVRLAVRSDGIPAIAFSVGWYEEVEPDEWERRSRVYYSARGSVPPGTPGWPETPETVYPGNSWLSGASLDMNRNASPVAYEPRIAYACGNTGDSDVKYATKGATGWSTTTVTSGFGPHLVLDPTTFNPRIAYTGAHESVWYAWNNGSGWDTTLVAGDTQIGYPACTGPSLGLDPNTGWGRIVYLNNTGTGAHDQTVRAKCYDGSNWVGMGCGDVTDDERTSPRIAVNPVSGMPCALGWKYGTGLIVAYLLSGGPVQQWHRITDNASKNLVLFGSGGDVVITKGQLYKSPTAVPSPDALKKEFILTDSSSNEVALVRADTGNVYIAGSVTDEVGTPSPSDPAMIIKDSSADIQSFIDENGDMELTGFVYEKGVKKSY